MTGFDPWAITYSPGHSRGPGGTSREPAQPTQGSSRQTWGIITIDLKIPPRRGPRRRAHVLLGHLAYAPGGRAIVARRYRLPPPLAARDMATATRDRGSARSETWSSSPGHASGTPHCERMKA